MPQSADTHIGPRLSEVRKRRGLTQRELAAASGVSLSLVRQLEQGIVQDTRLETARKLATALRVSTSRLVRRNDEPDRGTEPWHPLRQAVEGPSVQPNEEPTVDGVRAGLPEIRHAYFNNRMADFSTLVSPLLRDVDALGDCPEARDVRAHLLHIAGSVLTQGRQFQAAETALSRALDDAPDRLRAASVINTWTWLLVRQGRVDEAREMAIRWADDLEPRMSRATADDLAAWGWLLLQLTSASLRDNRNGEAGDAMRLARAAAVLTGRELPRGDMRLATWGPVTVACKAAERDVVMERPEEVLKAAKPLEAAGIKTTTEYLRHRLDVAKAHLMLRQYGETIEVLSAIRERAPEWLTLQRYARDIMATVVERRRTLTPEMRSLADAVALPV
jgi:transcriptional regulator with XRE-family HTH domain